MAPRPTMTASQPVSCSARCHCATVRTSPLATTGISGGRAARTAAMGPSRASPEKPCARVRPCTVIMAAPASTRRRAKAGGVDGPLVPAQAVLDRDRDRRRHRATNGRHDLDRQVGLAHQGRAAQARGHPLGRAPHVDVEDARAHVDRHLGGPSQHLRLPAEDLDGEPAATQAGPHPGDGLGSPPGQRVGRQELGEGHRPRPAPRRWCGRAGRSPPPWGRAAHRARGSGAHDA